MQVRTLSHAFTVQPNPAARAIRFDAQRLDCEGMDPSYIVFPCDDDEDAFVNAAKQGYTIPEIKNYYMVQSGFKSLAQARRELHSFFNDLTGCAR